MAATFTHLTAISCIYILTCFPNSGSMSALCQGLFSSWSVCGKAMRLGLRLGREEFNAYQALAHQTVLFPKTTHWLLSVLLAGMWLTHENSAEKLVLCLYHLLVWPFVVVDGLCLFVGWFYFILFYLSLFTEMPSKKLVHKLLRLFQNQTWDTWLHSLSYMPPGQTGLWIQTKRGFWP